MTDSVRKSAVGFIFFATFCLACIWAGLTLFSNIKTEPAPKLKLIDIQAPPDLEILAKRIKNTAPATPDKSWLPKSASTRWQWIILHHSASPGGSAAAINRYHAEERKMENGLAYHFVIGNGNGSGDGEVEIGNRWLKQLDGGHVDGAKFDKISIGICLVGNFELTMPTTKQIASLKALIKTLQQNFNVTDKRIRGHNKMPKEHTACPGTYFPVKDLLKNL